MASVPEKRSRCDISGDDGDDISGDDISGDDAVPVIPLTTEVRNKERRVFLASTSPLKLRAVKKAFPECTIVAEHVESGVDEQPRSVRDMTVGAWNRAIGSQQEALKHNCGWIVGIESGIVNLSQYIPLGPLGTTRFEHWVDLAAIVMLTNHPRMCAKQLHDAYHPSLARQAATAAAATTKQSDDSDSDDSDDSDDEEEYVNIRNRAFGVEGCGISQSAQIPTHLVRSSSMTIGQKLRSIVPCDHSDPHLTLTGQSRAKAIARTLIDIKRNMLRHPDLL
jgi:hypothetical protein